MVGVGEPVSFRALKAVARTVVLSLGERGTTAGL